jgi:hypothetical protein
MRSRWRWSSSAFSAHGGLGAGEHGVRLQDTRLYFLDHREGGFDLNQETRPTYSDFGYFAFTIGMSFAVPEIEPTDTDTRREGPAARSSVLWVWDGSDRRRHQPRDQPQPKLTGRLVRLDVPLTVSTGANRSVPPTATYQVPVFRWGGCG